MLNIDFNQFIWGFVGLIFATIVVIFLISLIKSSLLKKGRVVKALNMKLFLVTLPKDSLTKKSQSSYQEQKEILGIAEQFLSNLAQITPRGWKDKWYYGPPHIVFEIAVPHVGEEIHFYIAVPRKYEDFIEKQIHGFYPDAQIEPAEDYNIFAPESEASGGYFTLNKKYILPFRTYKNLEADPLGSITNGLSKIIGDTEGGALQIILRPAPKNWNVLAVKTAELMSKGKSFESALSSGHSTKEIFEPPKKEEKDYQTAISPMNQEIINALKEKASKPAFEVNVRVLTSAETQERSDQLLSHIEGTFDQFNSPTLNSLKFNKVKNKKLKELIYNFSFRLFDNKQKMILNSEEVASIFHFPSSEIETPRIKWLKARPAPPPANLPEEGLVLGRNIYRGEERVVRIKKEDRRRHLYVIGQTGTGKSVFLQNMIKQDIENGEGVAVLDPHGDLVENILTLIPKERIEDVIYFNPADLERPMGLNMLEYDPQHPEQKSFVVNEMINIFDKLYDLRQVGGPMFEQYARNAMLLVMDDPDSGSTLLEIPKVLADADFRKYKLSKCRDETVKHFWEKEAEKAGGEAALANMVPYVTSKMNMFLTNEIMRPIVCQQENSFDFRKIMDEKKILLVNLSKGKLGTPNSSLLGLIIVGKLLMAALSRIDILEEKRNDFYLYMDEFQNFTTESIATILAEARKYRLNLTIAHQFIGQLEEKIKNAVFGNVGSMVCFRIGPEDAEFMVKQFEPVFTVQDLINIDNFNAYLKLLIDGKTTKPFNIATYPPKTGDPKIAEAVKEFSRFRYGRERAIVEKEITERAKVSEKQISDNAEDII